MVIVLDFDNVLFNIGRFKKSLALIFSRYGLDFYESYQKCKKTPGLYTFKKHLSLLPKGIERKKLEADLEKLLLKSETFLFPDVKEFLRKIESNTVILLTRGKRDFQEKKIYRINKKLTSLFDKIIIVEEPKVNAFKKIFSRYHTESIIFIDDTFEELAGVKKEFNSVITILMRRNRAAEIDSQYIDFKAKDLKEAYRLIRGK